MQRFERYEDIDAAECTIEEREEYEPHLAEGNLVFAGIDYAAILSIREDLHLPVGRFADVLTTGDYVGLEPGVVEHKFFARGVGPVLSLHVSPTGGREILVAHSPAG